MIDPLDIVTGEQKQARLRAFFPPDQVAFEPLPGTNAAGLKPGDSFVCGPFVIASAVVDRLDDVLGAANWSELYTQVGDVITCVLSARLAPTLGFVDRNGVSVVVGTNVVRAHAEALRMAAARLGIGRYLGNYYQSAIWAKNGGWEKKSTLPEPALPEGYQRCGREKGAKLRGMLTQALDESAKKGLKLDPYKAAAALAESCGYRADANGQVNFGTVQNRHCKEMLDRLASWLTDLAGMRVNSPHSPLWEKQKAEPEPAPKEEKPKEKSAPSEFPQSPTLSGEAADFGKPGQK